MVMVEKLVLEFRHVHVGGTFSLAGLALQAKIHHVMESFAGETLFRNFAGQDGAQCVGAPARRMLFIQGAHIRWTHGPVQFLPALAHAAAHLDCSRKPSLLAEIQSRFGLPGFVLGTDPQKFSDSRRIDDLAGVHQVLWVEYSFDLPERFIEYRPEKLLV